MRALALTILLFAACGGDDSTGAGTDAAVRPRVFGGARPVTLQVPTGFVEGKSYPLIMILHGYGVSGFVQQAFLGLGDVENERDALVLAPDGTTDTSGRQFWNADPACCDLGGTGVDDSAYLRGVLDEVIAAWPVDPARVWLVGHSNGSFMAYRMACDHADVVTAIAGLAGLGPSVPCTPARHVGVLHLHGDADEVVPYAGGGGSPGAVETVAAWAQRNGCTGAATAGTAKDLDTGLAGAETSVAITGGCPADGAADLWTIAGGSHLPTITATFDDELIGWLAAHPR